MSLHLRQSSLMLNATNETVWIGKVPAALGTDHCGYGLDGMLCAFVVSWRLTTPDIIRSLRRSTPRATVFALHLIIPQHYSNWGLWNMHFPIRRAPPPSARDSEFTQAITLLERGRRSTKHAPSYLTEVTAPTFILLSEVFFITSGKCLNGI